MVEGRGVEKGVDGRGIDGRRGMRGRVEGREGG